MTGSAAAPRGWLDTLVDFARARPGTTLAILLGFHLVVWTVLPALLSQNLQLDLAEDLALGKEWQLGYWKHPPLPWWIAEFTYQATGRIAAIYVLGPLSAVVCLAVVWLLARELVGGFQALIAVAVLEGAHFYNFSVPKFAHDQVQLPFWALTGLFFCRALLHGRVRDWALAGAMLALCFWSKYAAFALAASLALFLLFDRDARRTLVTPKPYVMAAVFLVVIAPNLWWLVTHDFMPFRYVDARARLAVTLVEDVTFPLRWIGGQIFFLLPTLALLALAYWPRPAAAAPAPGSEAFARRIVTMLALGPFLVTTLVAIVTRRLPIAMWGYPLWSFAPLAAMLWAGAVTDPKALRRLAAGILAVMLAMPLAYAGAELLEPLVRDRPKATQFPGRELAATVTRTWRERFGVPLRYVGGSEFPTNNVAVYSPDRPHVIPLGDVKRAPWVSPDDLARYGAVIVWDNETTFESWREKFPGLERQPDIVLPRKVWLHRGTLRPERIGFAILPPRN